MQPIEISVYDSRDRNSKIIQTTIDKISLKNGIPHKHILSINDIDYKIQFYAPTWIYNDGNPRKWKEWNMHCGKLRTKRYIHLYKKRSLAEQIEYINTIIAIGGCYLLNIKNGY